MKLKSLTFVLIAIFPLLFFILCPEDAFSQVQKLSSGGSNVSLEDENKLVGKYQVKILEPTAASLGKYGEYPVNYSSGLPTISIPLYEIKSGDLTLNLGFKLYSIYK